MEKYSVGRPKMLVGNLVIGERYIEASGLIEIKNLTTGEMCKLEFKPRGWSAANQNYITGQVFDSDGTEKYKLDGKYTESITCSNLETQEKRVIFQPPKDFYPANKARQYGMNNFSIQLNFLNDELKAKLPPTDSRLRPDLRGWEDGDLDLATAEKARLEEI